MLCLEIWVKTRPPLAMPALDRQWWISWTYGPERGHLAGATCACETLCSGSVRGEVLEEALHQAVRAGIARAHRLSQGPGVVPARVRTVVVAGAGFDPATFGL